MIRAVLFDFDGVVVQSEHLHMDSFMELLAPFGVKVSEERWYREFAGTGSRSIIERLAAEYGIPADIGELVEKRKKLYEDRVRKGELKETPGVKEFLMLLKERGIRAAIVSGSHSSNVRLAISTLGLGGLFEIIVSGDDIESRKPDPGPFLHAAEKLGVKPSECIAIEDSYAGCESARRAGMMLVWVRPPVDLGPQKADLAVRDFRDSSLLRMFS